MSIQNIKFSKEFANNLERIHRLAGLPPFAVFRGSLGLSNKFSVYGH